MSANGGRLCGLTSSSWVLPPPLPVPWPSVSEIASRHALSDEMIDGVGERTGGVPLFVEEVTRLLLERGEAGGLQAIPPTLQQSLAARLDRLGEARDVAQIGAVLGRDFSYALLQAVGGIADPTLESALDRLVDADLLFVEGAGAQATYSFRHALIQDAAYESLLKSRSQALHRRAAEILRDDPDRAAAEPELIAHHFTEAGLDDPAIEWWGKAGDQALRRSAFQEAIAHLGKAIEIADRTSAASQAWSKDAAAASQRLRLHNDYALAVTYSKGYAAAETEAAFARASELASKSVDFSERFAAAAGQWRVLLIRGELRPAHEVASKLLREAEAAGRVIETGIGRVTSAISCYYSGNFAEARTHGERALDACDPACDQETLERYGYDTGTGAMYCLAWTCWQLGEVERARELIDRATRRGAELGHAPTLVESLAWKAISRSQSGRRRCRLERGRGPRGSQPRARNDASLPVGRIGCGLGEGPPERSGDRRRRTQKSDGGRGRSGRKSWERILGGAGGGTRGGGCRR